VQPSALDIEASVRFLESLGRHPRVRKGKLRVGLVGNRLKPNTNASQQAMDVLRSWPFPLVAQLRDSQAYVVLTGLGKSLFDYHSAQVRDHQADWQPLLHWLKKD
ncbi:MAG TPA: ParA family protein, partial [Thermomonas sp.]|nr:ParA family protein [Thermomonas sp.]